MSEFVKGLFVTTVGLWAGAGIFFSMVTLPTLFLNLETSAAGQTAALLFPGYYAFGLGVGSLLLIAVLLLLRSGTRAWYAVVFAVALALSCQAYAASSVRPRMSELRGDPGGIGEFQRLHRLSVRLNAVVLVVTVTLLGASARLIKTR